MTKSKRSKEQILNDLKVYLKKDKSNDIIDGNPFFENEKFQKELFNNMFYEKMKGFFMDYLSKMNPSLIDDKKYKINKMF